MQLSPTQNKSSKIPELVMQALINALESGQIQVGKELTSERTLAEKLGVGRGSLRECLAILEFLGVIESRGYRKVVAKEADYIRKAISFIHILNEPDTQNDLNEFRKINEMAIVELACRRATQENLDTILTSLNKMEERPNDLLTVIAFHDAVAIASHNQMLMATIHLANSILINLQNRNFNYPYSLQRVFESHKAIYTAIKESNIEVAKMAMKHHLELTEEFTSHRFD